MKSKYYPPTFQEGKFHCILCQVFASQGWYDVYILVSSGYIRTNFKASRCAHCDNWTFWYKTKMIVPSDAPVEPHHPDLPSECIADYTEARDVFSKSPRSSAALLRLCIQKLMVHLGEKGKNINDDIALLVAKGLPTLVQKALDFCRVVGNNAVHPGEIEINDTPEIAQNLFQMINFIVEDRIAHPKEIETLYLQLPEESRKAIEERDKKSK
jgi:hypothetical protein